MADVTPQAMGMTLRDYLDVLWRWKWLLVLVVVSATLVAYLSAARQTPQYAATASLLYEKPIDVSNPLSAGSNWIDPTQQALDVQSVGTVIASPDMQARVERLVGAELLDRAAFSVSAAAVQPDANSSYTNVATITVTGSDADQDARLANAYAEAFISWRKERQRAQVRQAETVLQSKMNGFTAPATHNSADYIMLEQRLRDLQILEATLTGDFRLVDRRRTSVGALLTATDALWRAGIRRRVVRRDRPRLPPRAAQHAAARLPRDRRDPAYAGRSVASLLCPGST